MSNFPIPPNCPAFTNHIGVPWLLGVAIGDLQGFELYVAQSCGYRGWMDEARRLQAEYSDWVKRTDPDMVVIDKGPDPREIEIAKENAIECLKWKGGAAHEVERDRASDSALGSGTEGEPVNPDLCPDCGKEHPHSALDGCLTVKGRRGWRQLGVYDS